MEYKKVIESSYHDFIKGPHILSVIFNFKGLINKYVRYYFYFHIQICLFPNTDRS